MRCCGCPADSRSLRTPRSPLGRPLSVRSGVASATVGTSSVSRRPPARAQPAAPCWRPRRGPGAKTRVRGTSTRGAPRGHRPLPAALTEEQESHTLQPGGKRLQAAALLEQSHWRLEKSPLGGRSRGGFPCPAGRGESKAEGGAPSPLESRAQRRSSPDRAPAPPVPPSRPLRPEQGKAGAGDPEAVTPEAESQPEGQPRPSKGRSLGTEAEMGSRDTKG